MTAWGASHGAILPWSCLSCSLGPPKLRKRWPHGSVEIPRTYWQLGMSISALKTRQSSSPCARSLLANTEWAYPLTSSPPASNAAVVLRGQQSVIPFDHGQIDKSWPYKGGLMGCFEEKVVQCPEQPDMEVGRHMG